MLNIRFGEEKDYIQLAELKWLHMKEDDMDYNETNLNGIDKETFIGEYVSFLKNESNYKIFVAEDSGIIVSAMFLYVIPKLPKPNRKSESIAYLTSVYTLKNYRNKSIGTQLLTFIKDYALKEKCELLFVWPSSKSVSWYEKNGFKNENEILECILMDEWAWSSYNSFSIKRRSEDGIIVLPNRDLKLFLENRYKNLGIISRERDYYTLHLMFKDLS